jgi:hypothetical protein
MNGIQWPDYGVYPAPLTRRSIILEWDNYGDSNHGEPLCAADLTDDRFEGVIKDVLDNIDRAKKRGSTDEERYERAVLFVLEQERERRKKERGQCGDR